MLFAAQAGATTLATGNSITFGSFKVSVNSCSGAICNVAEFAPTSDNQGFIITGSGGGTLESATYSIAPACADSAVTFDITSTTPISAILLQGDGSAGGGDTAKVDETPSSGNGGGKGTWNAGGPDVVIPLAGGPYTDVVVTKDIATYALTSGSTATINSVTQEFLVPEPSSLAVFGVALMSLVFWKRQRR